MSNPNPHLSDDSRDRRTLHQKLMSRPDVLAGIWNDPGRAPDAMDEALAGGVDQARELLPRPGRPKVTRPPEPAAAAEAPAAVAGLLAGLDADQLDRLAELAGEAAIEARYGEARDEYSDADDEVNE